MQAPASHLLANLLRFFRLLRGLGLAVTVEQAETALAAARLVGLESRARLGHALRAVLVGRWAEVAVFDRAFERVFRAGVFGAAAELEMGRLLARSPKLERRLVSVLFRAPGEGEAPPDADPDGEPLADRRGTTSDRELLRHKDFAELTAEELGEIRRLIRQLDFRVEPRRTRRFAVARRGERPDLRKTLRRSLARGGELCLLARRERRWKPRPLVVLCDVSGSMESYSRLLLELVAVLGRQGGRRELFAFGTRLTRLTPALALRDLDQALAAATAAVVDWGGGTRIGESLRRFNLDWGRRVLGQGAVVLLISDGLERGDPALLGRELARLRLSSSRLVWLNPLLGHQGYQPLARGMAAALPWLDDFLPVHDLQSLEQLARALASLAPRRQSRR